jgi:hypothetical protein
MVNYNAVLIHASVQASFVHRIAFDGLHQSAVIASSTHERYHQNNSCWVSQRKK